MDKRKGQLGEAHTETLSTLRLQPNSKQRINCWLFRRMLLVIQKNSFVLYEQ